MGQSARYGQGDAAQRIQNGKQAINKLLATLDTAQASAEAVKDVKRLIAKRIIKAMETVDGRMSKAM